MYNVRHRPYSDNKIRAGVKPALLMRVENKMTIEEEYVSLRKKIIEHEFANMNPQQFDAVVTVGGPLLILAGAGSGKTTVLINRIVNMIKYGIAYRDNDAPFANEEDIDELKKCLYENAPIPSWVGVDTVKPWEILAITFTNKAARELKERLEAANVEGGSEVWAATFHSTCSRILRKYADRIGFSNNYTIYATDDQRRLMKEVMRRLEIDEKVLGHKAILSEISHAKDSLISPEEYASNANSDVRLRMIADAYAKYQSALKEYDAMDFDDLIVNTVKLFTECPDVLDYYQNRFKYIMIDEYQDTNHAQYVFAKLLAQKYRNICVVGDDDQSIYRFRGATIENILNFEEQYTDAKAIRLEQNYRSTQIILDAANAVIANNSGRKGKRLWTAKDGGEKITWYTANNEQEEARFIADKIEDDLQNGMKPSDHAVLYRMNAQSNAIENVLMRSGISYRVVGGMKFFDRKEIRDVLAYLNVINNSSDGIALMRIINEPKRGIGDTTVRRVAEIAAETGLSMLEIMSKADEYAVLSRSAVKLKQFYALIDDIASEAESMTPHEILELVLDKSGYMAALVAGGEEELDRVDNVNEFSSNIVQYENENEDATLSGFLEEIALITDLDTEDAETDRVLLMTMHTAKGLEFPVVFIAGVEDGIFPGNMSINGTNEDMEEERRLAYVGITRAKSKLYITNAASRMLYGRTERSRPSRFIAEIPDSLIERESAVVSYGYGSKSGYNDFGSSGYRTPFDRRTYDNSSYSSGAAKPIPQNASYSEGNSKYKSVRSTSVSGYVQKSPVKHASVTVGQRVRHKVFGEGMVVSATPMGNDTLLEIAFDRVGTKKIMSNFAKLEKI